MTRRIPIVATLVVLVAVGIMIRLGFWQLERLHQKEAMLAQFKSAAHAARITDFSQDMLIDGPGEYTRVRLKCSAEGGDQMLAGRNVVGTPGWSHWYACQFPFRMKGTSRAEVVIGWSTHPTSVVWKGGEVTGTLVPSKGQTHRVVADPPLAGLQPNARPDPRDLPNNHLSYAVQWFAFAAVALVIYGLALRKRLGG